MSNLNISYFYKTLLKLYKLYKAELNKNDIQDLNFSIKNGNKFLDKDIEKFSSLLIDINSNLEELGTRKNHDLKNQVLELHTVASNIRGEADEILEALKTLIEKTR